MLCVILMKNTRCDRTTASVLARSANDAANLEMGLTNDAARLRTASVRQDQRKCLLTASVRQNERHLSAIARHQPTPVLARLGNAASQLPLRGQPRRKALRGY